ncbi:LuxR C-terminal-related transcriptional regulator [Sphingobium sp. Sx8-8]|uniref:helix-turn-helix transcriptional regulator n=1 Tax=Sphingobium sp. Sx8-8 TaxID=2933617 RepID=UPI001F575738|nr:LuxR C-terminal-related transcriptional regulator [Sphingobium sp. Sx8-8]
MQEADDRKQDSGMSGGIALKTVPPRAPQIFLVRPHLALQRIRLADIDLIEIIAPHGFGKTSQLAQWHREALVAGIVPIWLSLDSRDDPFRLIRALSQAVVRASAYTIFPASFVEWIGGCTDPQEAITAWLAHLSGSGQDLLLLIDDVDHAPETTLAALDYLLANAPTNLRIALGRRPSATLASPDILGNLPLMRITARDLRLREEETIRLVQQSLRTNFNAELAARIHVLTEGWPLGVRLAIASQLRSPSPADLDGMLSSDLGQYFLDSVISKLPPRTAEMLVDIAQLDPIHPDLCRAMIGEDAPVEEMERLAAETPVLTHGETGGWLRLHPSAREVLVPRRKLRPPALLHEQALRARDWYQDHGLLEEAAQQAALIGDESAAMALAEASLAAMTRQGRNNEVLEWYGRVSPDEIGEHPGFWAPTGWALALSNRRDEARGLVDLIRQAPASTEAQLYEADLILAATAGYVDDLMQMEEFASRWPTPPASADASSSLLHAVTLAHRALLMGQPELVRQCLAPPLAERAMMVPASWGYADLLIGMSYYWEGKVELAADQLRTAFNLTSKHMDRRNRVVSMIAGMLAIACLECGRAEEAGLHLSLRVNMIEKHGVPETVMAAFATLAELSIDGRHQDQAAVQYGSLAAEGRARRNSRMEAAAYFGLARLHARHGRLFSARQEVERADALLAALSPETPAPVRLWCALQAELARATVLSHEGMAKAAEAEASASRALALAMQLNRGAEIARALFLRAQARERLGDERAALDLTEAESLCEAGGLRRLKAEFTGPEAPRDQREAPAAPPPQPSSLPNRGAAENMLTPREQDVLARLMSHMSNKEIALSMGVGEETIKWHLKNLFHKLGAGDRKSAVKRARMLGLA